MVWRFPSIKINKFGSEAKTKNCSLRSIRIGKSTLIRCINRLEEHQEGNIIVDGTELTEDTKNIEQIRAEVGMVFQQFNIFPHLSI